MKRQALALDLRDTAGQLAVARRPSDLFRLSRRIDRLGTCLAQIAAAEGRRVLEQETSPPDLTASDPTDCFA
jgi:hypothetical protein